MQLAEVFYSWGVLHHTGRVCDGVAAAASRIAPGGVFHLALYNRSEGWRFHGDGTFGPSTFWVHEKRIYNTLPAGLQRGVEGFFSDVWFGLTLLRGGDPFREIREHRIRTTRGMSWIIDLRDWLGGYPYEFASPDEVESFCCGRLGLEMRWLLRRSGTRNIEYIFQRTRSRSLGARAAGSEDPATPGRGDGPHAETRSLYGATRPPRRSSVRRRSRPNR